MITARKDELSASASSAPVNTASVGVDFVAVLRGLLTQSNVDINVVRLRFVEFGVAISDIITGSAIVPVPQHVAAMVSVSNRIVSFVLDGTTHFGTGILVGPAHVLTAAHLLFDPDGSLVRSRVNRLTVEVHTTLSGKIVVEGGSRVAHLDPGDNDQWLVDPKLNASDMALRDTGDLDFMIVQLKERIGDDPIGGGQSRGWFEIPTTATARILAPDTVIRVFEYLDRGDLLTSGGIVRGVSPDRMRLLHSASTSESASGAGILDDDLSLVGIHLAGPEDAEVPPSNRGLPIRRVAEVIDQSTQGAPTIRSRIK